MQANIGTRTIENKMESKGINLLFEKINIKKNRVFLELLLQYADFISDILLTFLILEHSQKIENKQH